MNPLTALAMYQAGIVTYTEYLRLLGYTDTQLATLAARP